MVRGRKVGGRGRIDCRMKMREEKEGRAVDMSR